MKQLIVFFMGIFIIHKAQSESVYACKTDDNYKYQSTPCPKGAVIKKIAIHPFKPDPITLERLEQQRMEFLQQSNPAEFNRIRRAKMTPEERIADEKLEEERLQQQMQQIQAQRQLQLQRQILARQQQLEEQIAQQQRQMEEQAQPPQWWQWQNLNLQPPHWQRHQDFQQRQENVHLHGELQQRQ